MTGKAIPGAKPLTDAESLGYLRYAAGRGDKQTSMSLVSHVGRLGKAATAAEDVFKNNPTDENRAAAEKARQHAKDAQLVLLEAGDSTLPPWLGGSDRQKLAEGTFDLDTDEAAIGALASGKLTADAFSAMDINNRYEFVKALTSFASKDPVEQEAYMTDVAEKKVKEDEKSGTTFATPEQRQAAIDKAKQNARQNFAQAIIPIDKAQHDPRLNRGLAARDIEQYDSMRASVAAISGNLTPMVETGKLDADKKPIQKPYGGAETIDRSIA